MEARLSAPTAEASSRVRIAPPESAEPEVEEPKVERVASEQRTESPPSAAAPVGGSDDDAPFWPDESAEVAFLSEAKTRGELTNVAPSTRAATVAPEENESRAALPPLEELVQRIPENVRETLDELFRVKYVTVKRIPKTSFKQ